MKVNQAGEPIEETELFAYADQEGITDQDRNVAIALILEHLGREIWRTNATKHGVGTMLVLRKITGS